MVPNEYHWDPLGVNGYIQHLKVIDQPIIDRNAEPKPARNHDVEWHASALHRVMKHGVDIG